MPKLIQQLFAIDVRTLALFRIGLGVLLLADLIGRSFDLVAFYTDKGILPRAAFLLEFAHSQVWSLHLMSGQWWWQVFLFALAGICAVFLLFGYRTRTVTIISWILLTSVQYRNPMILQGGDGLLRLMVFWAMFLPLGAAYSVDAALEKEQHTKQRILSWGTVAILVQVGVLYWFTTALKQGAQWIPDGTAVYYALMIDQFATPFGLWLRQFPSLMQALTYIVFALEFLAIFFLFPIWKTFAIRYVGLVLLIGMHIGMGLGLALGLFPLVDIVALLIFLPGSFWDWLNTRTQRNGQSALRVYYEGDCGFCEKAVRLIMTVLFVPLARATPAQSEHHMYALMNNARSWVVVDANNVIHYGFAGFVAICSCSPLVAWMTPLLSQTHVMRMGEAAYSVVRDNRGLLSTLTARLLPYRSVSLSLGIIPSLFAICCLSGVLWWNIADLVDAKQSMPKPARNAMYVFHLDQKWNMFAPYPRTDDGWLIIEGLLRDGSEVDVYRETEGKPSYEKPAMVSREFENRYWRKYLMNLPVQRYAERRRYYGRYICRSWNADAAYDKQLTTFQIYFYQEQTLADYTVKGPVLRLLWEHDCFYNSTK